MPTLLVATLVQLVSWRWECSRLPQLAGHAVCGALAVAVAAAVAALMQGLHLSVSTALVTTGGLIPLVPGILSTTVTSNLLRRDWRAGLRNGWQAVKIAAALALGAHLFSILLCLIRW